MIGGGGAGFANNADDLLPILFNEIGSNFGSGSCGRKLTPTS
jgi:hypothetical protein